MTGSDKDYDQLVNDILQSFMIPPDLKLVCLIT